MTARMVLRLSVIVQGLVIQFGLRLALESLCLDAFSLREPVSTSLENALDGLVTRSHHAVSWAAGRGDRAPSGDRRAWSQNHGSVRPDGRLAHNHCAVALIRRPPASPIREAGAGCGYA